ncbi:uncharacterized protein [Rutidosis leptorrhynchoides]|uniref:uncharacterized protein n=1 Tax=Rutidosis leptorrhynchoides TaxID=125765 RepID=UPI003A9A0B27
MAGKMSVLMGRGGVIDGRARKKVDELGISFTNSFTRVIENAADTRFWEDTWVGDTRFKDKYKRLYRLVCDKNVSVQDCNGVYSVSNLVEIIDGTALASHTDSMETLRNRLVPKKIEVFIWRARRGRIPVRLELDKRGIDLHSTRCPVCDGDLESVEHVLFLCRFAKDIWGKVLNW